MSACGKKCGASTGICGSITFGSGELDTNGYWEFPCFACARDFEKAHPEHSSCWPFEEPTRAQELVAEAEILAMTKDHLAKAQRLLGNLVASMRMRKAREDGSEPYRKETWARFDESFIEHDAGDLLATAIEELEKVKIPEG